jgi:hypothetical protein
MSRRRLSTKALEVLRDGLRAVDRSPVAPYHLGEKVFDRYIDRSKRAAAKDPVWSAIEQRRRKPGTTGFVTMLSDDLSMADWLEQDRIEEELTPKPWWAEPARKLIHFRLASPASAILERQARAEHGWARNDVWSFDHYITRVTGEALAALAKEAHGHPCGTYDSFEEWTDALRANSDKLLAYAHRRGEDEGTAFWHTLAGDRNRAAETKVAFDALHDLEEANLKGARQAMKWVAKNLGSLWD